MKVGIVTFHWAHNYGAVLQAFALAQEVNRLGHDVEFIDYNPFADNDRFNRGWLNLDVMNGGLRRRFKKAYLRIKNYSLARKYARQYQKGFYDFRKMYLPGSGGTEIRSSEYDAVIVGSDQVWNSSWIGNCISYYYLEDFPKSKKVSYAACVGNPNQPSVYEDRIKSLLNDFNAISVRNSVSSNYIRRITGKEPIVVCDPTFLYNFEECDAGSERLKQLPSEYILIYALDENVRELGMKIVEAVKKEKNIPVVSISSTFHTGWSFKHADFVLYDATPMEWLSLFQNATFTCTDSFHGLVFSLKNKKPFIGYCNDGWRSFRLTDITNRYDLSDFLISPSEMSRLSQLLEQRADYESCSAKLENDIRFSRAFLEKSL